MRKSKAQDHHCPVSQSHDTSQLPTPETDQEVPAGPPKPSSCGQLFPESLCSKAADRCLTSLMAERDHGVGATASGVLPQLQSSSEPTGQEWCHCCISQDPAGPFLYLISQLLSLCSQGSVPEPHLALREEEGSGTAAKPLSLNAQSSLCSAPAACTASSLGHISALHGAQTCSCWMQRAISS